MFSSIAFAQAAVATGQEPNALLSVVPFVFIFGVMYFLVIRPQSKRQKEHGAFLKELKRGDEVLTTGGILGRIEGLTDSFVTLEVSDGVRLKLLRNAIAGSSKTAIEGKA